MMERKSLTITEVDPIKKVGDKQIPKLTFKAKDDDKELVYLTFKSSVFDLIKTGATIDADIEVKTREYDGNTYTDRRVVQVYVDGQPISPKNPYRGKSPEELELSAKSYALSYAKDLAVAKIIPLENILPQADMFYQWLKGQPAVSQVAPKADLKTDPPFVVESDDSTFIKDIKGIGNKIQNVTEFKGLLSNHKVGTREAYEILSINSFMELVDLDEAWKRIKEAKKIA